MHGVTSDAEHGERGEVGERRRDETRDVVLLHAENSEPRQVAHGGRNGAGQEIATQVEVAEHGAASKARRDLAFKLVVREIKQVELGEVT